jgi:enoyl-CoA hydratase
MGYKYFLVDIQDRVGTVTFNRPPVNALNTELVGELYAVIDALDKDRSVRVIVLTGSGKAFVAGADIGEMCNLSPLGAREFARNGHKTLSRIEQAEKPVICAINGFALGGGCEIALACDIRIMADTAKIGQPEVSLGIIPGFGGTQRLSRLVGMGKAMEMIMGADPLDAAEALRVGLVDRVVHVELPPKPESAGPPPAAPTISDQTLAQARALAAKIASKGPVAVKLVKSVIRRGRDTNLAAGDNLEIEAFGICFSTGEPKEGMTAFLEKRKPNW